jgi:transposase
MSPQPVLLDIPEQPPRPEPPAPAAPAQPRLLTADRDQHLMIPLDVEQRVGPDHLVRAIWELSGQLDLSAYAAEIKSVDGNAGRPAWDPRLLVSLWVYAYSQQIRSARELEQAMGYEPGLQWLSGMQVINYHTLSDFRVGHKQALDQVFQQLLAILEQVGLVDLHRVMQDGTKIRAQASPGSFRREKSLRESLERARQVVEQAGDPRQEPKPERRRKAWERARREQIERLEEAVAECHRQQAEKTAKEAAAVRVSKSEPECRMMKQRDGGYVPAYNVQVTTDAHDKVIVATGVSQSSADTHELEPALERVEENLGRKPEEAVADGGYESRETIVNTANLGVDLTMPVHSHEQRAAAALKGQGGSEEFGPQAFHYEASSDTMRCPAGEVLVRIGRQSPLEGQLVHLYRTEDGRCGSCPNQAQCCPKNPQQGRTVGRLVEELPAIAALLRKMATEEAKQIYRQRGEVAEFPNAWLKEKIGLRRFVVRGKLKVGMEVTWASLSYNIRQWYRLIWRPQQLAAVA